MKKFSSLVGAVVLTVGAASGCAFGPEAPSSREGIATYPFEAGDSREGAAALLAGTVTVLDGCVYVTAPSGERTLPVFPASQVDRRGEGIAIRNVVYEPGDEIALGGGQRNHVSGATVPSGCDTTSMWTVTPE